MISPACNHILRPDKILEHVDYLARPYLACGFPRRFGEALQMYERATVAIAALEVAVKDRDCRINGVPTSASKHIWSDFRRRVENACREAILRSLQWDSQTGEPRRLPREARRLFSRVSIKEGEAFARALRLREADWAKRPYKEHLRWDAQGERTRIPGEEQLQGILWPRSSKRLADLRSFLDATRSENETTGVRRVNERCGGASAEEASMLPYLLATRPYTAQEVALYHPRECVFQSQKASLERWGACTPMRSGEHGVRAPRKMMAATTRRRRHERRPMGRSLDPCGK